MKKATMTKTGVDGQNLIARDSILYPMLREKDQVENFESIVKRIRFNLTYLLRYVHNLTLYIYRPRHLTTSLKLLSFDICFYK